MKILQISHSDIPGQVFDGYDLMNELNKNEISCKMIVKNKASNNLDVIDIKDECIKPLLPQIDALSNCYQMENILSPWVDMIIESEYWKKADIVHYHLLRAFPISVSNMSKLFEGKKTILTMHDFWPITGGCIHTLGCDKWKNGCRDCKMCDSVTHKPSPFASYQYSCKRKCFEGSNVEIVVSCDYTYNKVIESGFFRKEKIHKIGFGLKENQIQKMNLRKKNKIEDNMVVIGFRTQSSYIKGIKYVYEALEGIQDTQNVFLIGVGGEKIPDNIAVRYKHADLKWLDEKGLDEFYETCDIFLMPSIAESFGLMAIEAMSKECTVVCFKETALEEVVGAPDYGIAVKYKSSDELRKVLIDLINSPEKIKSIGEKSREYVCNKYKFDDYVNQHIELYKKVMEG